MNPRKEVMNNGSKVAELYSHSYAAEYERIYLDPWPEKHILNLKLLELILRPLERASDCWLDICCGQAWHFSQITRPIRKVGIDISLPQLQRAALRNPSSEFVCTDVSWAGIKKESVSLATSFWGAYCYLDDEGAIEELLSSVISWVAPGGAIYLEILTAENLRCFNTSPYAERTGFRVVGRSGDFRRWAYHDIGGEHLMCSPSLNFFLKLFGEYFDRVKWIADGFMVHLVARDKRLRSDLSGILQKR